MSISLTSQELIPFKSYMDTAKYRELEEAEKKANAASDQFEKASKFRTLAEISTRISDELGIIFYDKALEAAIASKNDSMIAAANMAGSIPFINTARYEEAEARLGKAFDYWQMAKDTLPLAKCYTFKGYLERVKGNNYLAIKNLYKAKRLKESMVPLSEMFDVVNRLIINYDLLGDYENAVLIGEEFIASARHLDPKPIGYRTILRNTGEIMLQKGDLEKAKLYIQEAVPMWMKDRIPKFMIGSYSLLHDLAIAEGNFVMAKVYSDSSLFYSLQFNSPYMLSEAHLRVYNLLKQTDQPEKAGYHVKEALVKAKESNRANTILNAAEAASYYEAEEGNYKEAFKLQHLSDSLRKEIYSEETTNEIKKLEKQLVFEKSEKEIQLLNEQNELKAQNLEKAVRLRRFLISSLVLALTSLLLIYFLLRQRSKNALMLQGKNETISVALSEKETLLREIHHRVKNNLQFISSLLGLQTEHVQDETALSALQEGQDRVQSMALIHQNLYQEDNLTGVDMHDYFQKLIQGLFDSYNIHDDRINLILDIEDLNLDVDTVIPIGLVLNELITNSLKYAFPESQNGTISISMKEYDERLHLSVSDDGVGMTEEQQQNLGESFGYRLVEAFATQLDAKLSIDRTDGTSVNFIIKNYQLAE